MIKRIFKKNRGSAEILGFIIILPFLLLPIFNTVHDIKKINYYDVLRMATNKAVLRMEIDGGLTKEAEAEILNYLQSKKIDISKVHIDYTPYPVPYGEDVRIRLSYTFDDVSYTIGLGGLGGLKKNIETRTIVYGPLASVSKKYQ